MMLTLDMPVTAKGDKPSLELVQLIAAQDATIKTQAMQIAAQAQIIVGLSARIDALETP